METKERILDCALDFFSRKGYDSSSVRDICKGAGIKESSLYFHFTNKQQLLDVLTEHFSVVCERYMNQMTEKVQNYTEMNDDRFIGFTKDYMQDFFLDSFIRKYILFLSHEQGKNEYLRQIYQKWCVQTPVEYQEKVFTVMQEEGYLKKTDIGYMALSYYAPIFLYFNECLVCEGEKNVQEKHFMEKVEEHIGLFLKQYKKVPTP